MSRVHGILEHLRQPSYTGENRCVPCTVLNIFIAIAISVGIAYGSFLSGVNMPTAFVFGVVVFGVSVVTIYLRGYLVPYTPTITKQYLPNRVLRWFEKDPSSRRTHPAPDDIDVEEELISLGVIAECPGGEDLCFDPTFHRDWRDKLTLLRQKDAEARKEDIAVLFELDDVEHSIRELGDSAAAVMVDNRQVGQWESDAAFLADLAADKVLRDRHDGWIHYHISNRSQLLNAARMFIERCPRCDAPVSMGQDTVDSCCRTMDVIAVSCTECGSRIFEVELTPEMRQQL